MVWICNAISLSLYTIYIYTIIYIHIYKIRYLQNPPNLVVRLRHFQGQLQVCRHQNDRCNGSVMDTNSAWMAHKQMSAPDAENQRRWLISMFARTLYVAQTPSLLANFEPWKFQGSRNKNHYSCIPKNSMKSNRKPVLHVLFGRN